MNKPGVSNEQPRMRIVHYSAVFKPDPSLEAIYGKVIDSDQEMVTASVLNKNIQCPIVLIKGSEENSYFILDGRYRIEAMKTIFKYKDNKEKDEKDKGDKEMRDLFKEKFPSCNGKIKALVYEADALTAQEKIDIVVIANRSKRKTWSMLALEMQTALLSEKAKSSQAQKVGRKVHRSLFESLGEEVCAPNRMWKSIPVHDIKYKIRHEFSKNRKIVIRRLERKKVTSVAYFEPTKARVEYFKAKTKKGDTSDDQDKVKPGDGITFGVMGCERRERTVKRGKVVQINGFYDLKYIHIPEGEYQIYLFPDDESGSLRHAREAKTTAAKTVNRSKAYLDQVFFIMNYVKEEAKAEDWRLYKDVLDLDAERVTTNAIYRKYLKHKESKKKTEEDSESGEGSSDDSNGDGSNDSANSGSNSNDDGDGSDDSRKSLDSLEVRFFEHLEKFPCVDKHFCLLTRHWPEEDFRILREFFEDGLSYLEEASYLTKKPA